MKTFDGIPFSKEMIRQAKHFLKNSDGCPTEYCQHCFARNLPYGCGGLIDEAPIFLWAKKFLKFAKMMEIVK